eukprot:TRINITY_DN114224_c0_g1_i1.p1 TRINITY_DN114224_c0_g1~~TRINITY_DN114224_c0_g1_i1.p1  ORF type:complete len:318 (-),score=20.97 TRINITY_DN114224_c0_g1_i1:171-1124(-)
MDPDHVPTQTGPKSRPFNDGRWYFPGTNIAREGVKMIRHSIVLGFHVATDRLWYMQPHHLVLGGTIGAMARLAMTPWTPGPPNTRNLMRGVVRTSIHTALFAFFYEGIHTWGMARARRAYRTYEEERNPPWIRMMFYSWLHAFLCSYVASIIANPVPTIRHHMETKGWNIEKTFRTLKGAYWNRGPPLMRPAMEIGMLFMFKDTICRYTNSHFQYNRMDLMTFTGAMTLVGGISGFLAMQLNTMDRVWRVKTMMPMDTIHPLAWKSSIVSGALWGALFMGSFAYFDKLWHINDTNHDFCALRALPPRCLADHDVLWA